ncbi:MAG: RcnB family protein [Allosphingosinicella sp.]
MSKLWLIGLAASAAWAPAGHAKGAPHPSAPPPIGHGAHAPGHGAHGGPGHHVMPPAMHGGGHMKGMKGWQRFGRGHVIPQHFRGRQFFVHDWRSFGFPAPMPGGRWIRYHDDALLIDGHGRVMDSRYDWDWDRRGGDMTYDDGGYDEYGRRDDRLDEDYGYEDRGDCRSDCGPVSHLPPPPRHPGYGHGYGYGYGAGCACGPVVVTETITTTAPVMETRTYYETVTEHRAAPRRHYRKPVVRYSKPVVRRSVKPAYRAPAPRPGERG